MKTPAIIQGTVNSKKHSDCAKSPGRTLENGRSLRVWQRVLGAGLLCLILLGVAMFRALPAPGTPPRAAASTPVHRASDHSLNHYFQSGQWRADMRTLASLFHYLMTPDSGMGAVTNRPVPA